MGQHAICTSIDVPELWSRQMNTTPVVGLHREASVASGPRHCPLWPVNNWRRLLGSRQQGSPGQPTAALDAKHSARLGCQRPPRGALRRQRCVSPVLWPGSRIQVVWHPVFARLKQSLRWVQGHGQNQSAWSAEVAKLGIGNQESPPIQLAVPVEGLLHLAGSQHGQAHGHSWET